MLAGIVRDDVDALKEAVLSHLVPGGRVHPSGGVSVGERDVVKAAFFRRGDVEFYKVAMQPGMPQGFGQIEGTPYFGLPGNPVSVFVSFEVFIRPALRKMMGRRQLFRPEVPARLEEDVTGPEGKTQFARVRVRRTKDGWSPRRPAAEARTSSPRSRGRTGSRSCRRAWRPRRRGAEVSVMLFRSMDE